MQYEALTAEFATGERWCRMSSDAKRFEQRRESSTYRADAN